MKKRILSVLVACAMVFSLTANVLTVFAADKATTVRLDPSNASPFGEFQGWGTSMGWWGNRIGYDDTLSEKAAQLFYDEETGLGLDIVRYNVGGGDHPEHNHITRSDSKLPCFAVPTLDADNNPTKGANGKFIYTYNWDNDARQVNVLRKIKAENDDVHIEGYTNSPPWFMTNTLCSGGGKIHWRLDDEGNHVTDSKGNWLVDSIDENLDPDNYDDFAEFIVEVTKQFDTWGLKFDSYSPMNEPNPATKYWGEQSVKQEGNHVAQGAHQAGLIAAIKDAYTAEGIDTLVVGCDETNIDYTVNGINAIKNISGAIDKLDRIDTHTYSGSKRSQLKELAETSGKNLWMSEVDGGWNGFGLADRIITDVNGMMPTAWVMWDIVDKHKDSTSAMKVSDEANASLDKAGTLWGVAMANHDTKEIELANKYYFFGHFTRYINPGDTIIASSNSTLAAYNKKSGDIKIVALNSSGSDRPYVFDLGAFTNVGNSVEVIRTNNETDEATLEHWKTITDGATLANKKITATLKAGTVTTFVVKGSESADTNYIAINGADRVALGDEAEYSFTSDIDNAQASWSTSDSSVASIDASGKLAALKKGIVTVTAAVGEKTGTKEVEVYFEITGAGDKIKLGSEVQLSAGNLEGVTWQSSDTDIATVSDTGLVKALAPGEFTVTATYGTDTAEKTFIVPSYILTGTPSWNNENNAPADKDDYTQVADGNFSTYFDGMKDGWVRYDFGAPYSVSKIKLASRSGYEARTKGGTIQGSSDGITWTDLYTETAALSASQYTEIDASQLKGLKAYRYYRYTNKSDYTNLSEFIIEGEPASGVPQGEPIVAAIDEFTDDFESSVNIFRAAQSSSYNTTGNAVFPSGLARFGKVFAPVKDKAVSELAEPIELSNKNIFRLTFNMFAGWEKDGKTNTFAINDENGNEIVALEMTGSGYTLEEIRINGENALTKTDVRAQCRASVSKGANGWNSGNQTYANNVGYNKTVEITIDGLGQVNVSLTGGLEEAEASGSLTAPVTIGSISAAGDYNTSVDRIVTYDNFVGDLITYVNEIEPTPTPVVTPEPSPLPIPANGELIHLDFDNKDLESSSSYGKASAVGTAKFDEVDGKTCLRLDGTNASAIKLTDANGNPLLTSQEEMTIAFRVKPTVTSTSWWFYAAPNDSAQTVNREKYIGAFTNGGKINVERYNNSGSRSASASGALAANEWSSVIITHADGETTVYVNGKAVSTVASSVNISDMLGNSSAAYIGKANWGSGEFATGYIDDFVIYNYAIPHVNAYGSGTTLTFTSDYGSDMPADMYLAVRDSSGDLVGVSRNTAAGSFTVSEDDEYTVTEYIWDGMTPVTEPVSITPNMVSKDGAYLFAHFRGEGSATGEQIYFSVSTDGENWKSLNGGMPVLTSTVGDKGVRDPYILRTNDNKFVIIATDLKINGGSGWTAAQQSGSKSIVVWKSDDLVSWGDAKLKEVAVPNAGCTWAPEAVYDNEQNKYMVFWSSKVSDDSYTKHRIYKTYTSDFETFDTASLYYEKDFSVIDTTIIEDKGTYYRFTKNEAENEKYIFMEKCDTLNGDWTEVSTFNRNQKGFEGPTIFKMNGQEKWCLMLDAYSDGGYKPFVTDNLSTGMFDEAGSVTYDATYRHGTILPITAEEYIRLITSYGI